MIKAVLSVCVVLLMYSIGMIVVGATITQFNIEMLLETCILFAISFYCRILSHVNACCIKHLIKGLL